MSHRRAVLLMVLITLLWSSAGVVSRQMEVAQGLTLAFWRSTFNAAALVVILCWIRTPAGLIRRLQSGGWPLWASGLCWAVMFTAFMWALTVTSIATVLVTMALGPLFTAVLARCLLGQALRRGTVMAVLAAGIGLALMQVPSWGLGSSGTPNPATEPVGTSWLGLLLAAAVPVAAGLNWVLIRGVTERRDGGHRPAPDFLVSVGIGALLSACLAGLAAQPLQASIRDLAWLAFLGVFQLAIPCLMAVRVAAALMPSEVALLSLLEVLFGVAWAWMVTAEQPDVWIVTGGAIVLTSLVLHQRWQAGHRRGGP